MDARSRTNPVQDENSLRNYLANDLLEQKITPEELASAMVRGLTSALQDRGFAVSSLLNVLSLSVSWLSGLIPHDLVTWLLGRDLMASDAELVERTIEDTFLWWSSGGLSTDYTEL